MSELTSKTKAELRALVDPSTGRIFGATGFTCIDRENECCGHVHSDIAELWVCWLSYGEDESMCHVVFAAARREPEGAVTWLDDTWEIGTEAVHTDPEWLYARRGAPAGDRQDAVVLARLRAMLADDVVRRIDRDAATRSGFVPPKPARARRTKRTTKKLTA